MRPLPHALPMNLLDPVGRPWESGTLEPLGTLGAWGPSWRRERAMRFCRLMPLSSMPVIHARHPCATPAPGSSWVTPSRSGCDGGILAKMMVLGKIGAPGTIRTCDPQTRNLVLYPAELRALRKLWCVLHLDGVRNRGARFFVSNPFSTAENAENRQNHLEIHRFLDFSTVFGLPEPRARTPLAPYARRSIVAQ